MSSVGNEKKPLSKREGLRNIMSLCRAAQTNALHLEAEKMERMRDRVERMALVVYEENVTLTTKRVR